MVYVYSHASNEKHTAYSKCFYKKIKFTLLPTQVIYKSTQLREYVLHQAAATTTPS